MMEAKYMEPRIRVGSSARRVQATGRQNERIGLGVIKLVAFAKALRRSELTPTVTMRAAAEGATDAELVALRSRSIERDLHSSKTAAYAALYGGK
jgi:hypothetical protein